MARPASFIKLEESEEKELRVFLNTGQHLARELTRGRLLLLNHEGQKLEAIAELLNLNYVGVTTVINRYKKGGLSAALYDRPRSGAPKKINQKVEAHVTALACSEEPEGQVRWTLELLHDKFIQINEADQLVDSLSKESIRTILKKANLNHGRPKNGVLKP